MTEEEETKYFDLALRMMRIGMPEYLIDRILQTSKLLRRKKGNASIMDIAKIMTENFRKYPSQPDPKRNKTRA